MLKRNKFSKKLNQNTIYNEFIKRASNWENNFNPVSGFMQPKLSDGSFKKDFDALNTNGQGFIEGNSWNYSFFVPQDPINLIQKMGGNKNFFSKLDSLFSMQLPDAFFAETEDITREGIIGGYVHGNEPAHHVAYLYNWTNQPWKTQSEVRHILKLQYKPTTDGLGGNDDCGQMSAWYVLSAMGFYPVAPGSDEYALGSPAITNASLKLENGNTFTVNTDNQSDKNVFVKSVLLNGKILDKHFIHHSDIMNGGTLKFIMDSKPQKK